MKELLDGLQLICLLVWVCAGVRVAYNGYLIQMNVGTMSNSHSAVNVDINHVENFDGRNNPIRSNEEKP